MSGYDEVVYMVNGTIADMAQWYLENDPQVKTPVTDIMIEEWIYEVKLTANIDQYRKLCEKFWDSRLN